VLLVLFDKRSAKGSERVFGRVRGAAEGGAAVVGGGFDVAFGGGEAVQFGREGREGEGREGEERMGKKKERVDKRERSQMNIVLRR
jgi:hypothetical protein